MIKPIARLSLSLAMGLSMALLVLWLAGSRLPLASAAGPWFVNTAGSDSNDCLTAVTACLTIGGAAGKAVSGDVIHVAAGTYTENVTISGKALTIIGAGSASTFVDGGSTGRVFETDADLALSDLTLQNGSVGDGGALRAASALTLTNVNVFSSSASFNGGGVYATGAAAISGSLFQGNTSSQQGGGLYISNTLALTNTQFVSNTAASWGGGARAVLAASLSGGQFQGNSADSGGGLFAEAGGALAGTQFLSNTANDYGGGAYFTGTSVLDGVAFAGNTANYGGGAQFDGPTIVTGTTFFSNTANTVGGGAYFNAIATLTNTTFTQNLGSSSSSGGGGATFAFTATVSGGAFVSNTSHFAGGGAYFGYPVTVTNTAFTSNTATTNRGGGAYFNSLASLSGATFTANLTPADRGAGAYSRDTAVLTGTDFLGNLAFSRGGGAYFFATGILTNTRFLTNTAGVHGGGAYFSADFQLWDSSFISNAAQTGNGGAVFEAGAGNGAVVNGLFTRNSAGSAGADLFLGSSGFSIVAYNTLANNSLSPNTAIYLNAGSMELVDVLFANYAASVVITTGVPVTTIAGFNLFYNAPTDITSVVSLTGTDPLFVDPAAGNFRLGAGSPASGAGLSLGLPTDLDGAPRSNPPSIGAYELPVYTLTVATAGTGQGLVTVAPSQTFYSQGSVVTLTAAPTGTSTFAGWSGAASGLTNPLTITMDSIKAITATFNLNVPPAADLKLSLRGAPSQAAAGGLVTYTLALTNTGPDLATTVRLTDTLSVSSTFQSLSSPAGWNCQSPAVGATGPVICARASLTAGVAATFTLTVQLSATLPALAQVSNTATATSALPDPTTPNTATATTDIFAYRYYWPFVLK